MGEMDFEELYVCEDVHWWHVGKRERVLYLLERFSNGSAAAKGSPVTSDNAVPPAWLNRVLAGYERWENGALRGGLRMPWGTSAVAVGRKPAAGPFVGSTCDDA